MLTFATTSVTAVRPIAGCVREQKQQACLGIVTVDTDRVPPELRMTGRKQARARGVDFTRAPVVLAAARAAIRDGIIGCALLVAEKPA